MSQINLERALALRQRMVPRMRLATLDPRYVIADAARDAALEPIFFAHCRGDDIWLHSGHLGRVPDSSLFDVQSPYGYGGPVSTSRAPEFLAEAWAAWRAWCRERGVVAEFVRFHPLAENWSFFGGEVVDDRQTTILDLQGPELMSRYEGRARTGIRKSVRLGLTTAWHDSADAFAEFGRFYRRAMEEIGATSFYMFDDGYFDALFRSGLARILTCAHEGEVVAAAAFLRGEETLEYHLAAADGKKRQLGAAGFVLNAAAESGRAEGLRELYLGGGTSDAEDNPLFLFKRSFSNRTAPFRFGRIVHDQGAYAALAERWSARTGQAPSRILFYR